VGNKIQKKIWAELKNIKIGHTKSYGAIAKKYKLSPRYIGKICSQNKLLLLVPCHRVIRTDGTLGGFTSMGGVKLKKKLLEFEKKTGI
jgi:O-6-methylguanine DNA methyltransferase